MRATVHVHETTGEAYDDCQTDEGHKGGDLIWVPSEGVVGICDTWPIAVTAAFGNLHQVVDWDSYLTVDYRGDALKAEDHAGLMRAIRSAVWLARRLEHPLSRTLAAIRELEGL